MQSMGSTAQAQGGAAGAALLSEHSSAAVEQPFSLYMGGHSGHAEDSAGPAKEMEGRL